MSFNLNSLKNNQFSTRSVLAHIRKTDQKLFSEVSSRINSGKITACEAFYNLIYPKARKTCSSPGCDNLCAHTRNKDFWGYNKYCSRKCCQSDPDVKLKQVETSKLRYGDNHPCTSRKAKKKREKTNLLRFGGHPMRNPAFRKRYEATCLRNFGEINPLRSEAIRRKIIVRQAELYKDTGYPMQSEASYLKRQEVYRSKYGVDHPMQNPAISHKSQINAYRVYQTTIKGKTFEYQGYEGYALEVLANQLKVPVKTMSTDFRDQHKISWYGKRITPQNPNPKAGNHIYTPDIRIRYKGKDITIEVKSAYTVGLHDLSTFLGVKTKCQAAFDIGVDLRVWVVEPGRKRITRIPNFHTLTQVNLRKLLSCQI